MTSVQVFKLKGSTFSIDPRPVHRLFEQAPKAMFRELEDAFGHIMAKTRKTVVDRQPGTTRKGMKALAHRGIRYTVWPRKGHGGDRRDKLSDIIGVLFATNAVPALHEFGGTTSALGRYMAIPIGIARSPGTNRPKRGFGSVRAAEATLKSRGKDLVPIKGKSSSDLILYERTKKKRRTKTKTKSKRRRGRPRKRYGLKPAFLLTKQVTVPASLGVQDTWQSLAGFRNQRLQRALTNVVERLAAQRSSRRAG